MTDLSDVVHPEGWKPPAGYSYGVVATGGRILHIAGQLGQDMLTGTLAASFAGQWEQALANVVEVVRAAGGQPTDIVALRVYVTDLDDYRVARREIGLGYRRQLGSHFPTMTLLQVSGLAEPGAVVEIEGEAVLPH